MRIFTQDSELIEAEYIYITKYGEICTDKNNEAVLLGDYIESDLCKLNAMEIAEEVMTAMAEFFDLFPNQLFYMPTQKEIEQRIIDGEDEE